MKEAKANISSSVAASYAAGSGEAQCAVAWLGGWLKRSENSAAKRRKRQAAGISKPESWRKAESGGGGSWRKKRLAAKRQTKPFSSARSGWLRIGVNGSIETYQPARLGNLSEETQRPASWRRLISWLSKREAVISEAKMIARAEIENINDWKAIMQWKERSENNEKCNGDQKMLWRK